jgi:hypothetical protein
MGKKIGVKLKYIVEKDELLWPFMTSEIILYSMKLFTMLALIFIKIGW